MMNLEYCNIGVSAILEMWTWWGLGGLSLEDFRLRCKPCKVLQVHCRFGSAYFTEPNSGTIHRPVEPIRSFNPEGIESK